ncbi:hypothetical protein ACFWCB_26225 [Streptomyces sp. NPDC060048]
MTDSTDQPAYHAALELADEGHHVHLIAENDTQCVSDHCVLIPGA